MRVSSGGDVGIFSNNTLVSLAKRRKTETSWQEFLLRNMRNFFVSILFTWSCAGGMYRDPRRVFFKFFLTFIRYPFFIFSMNGNTEPQQQQQEHHQVSRPHNVGTRENLPEVVRSNLRGGSSVIAWTKFDTKWKAKVDRATCCAVFARFAFDPLRVPRTLANSWDQAMEIRQSVWVLTNIEVRIFVLDFGYDGCCRSGNTMFSIPLASITKCGILPPGCCDKCVAPVPAIYVDTVRSQQSCEKHEAIGYGLVGYEWFVSAILQQRDQLRQMIERHVIIERGEPKTEVKNRTVTERKQIIDQKLTTDLENGKISQKAYDILRPKLIAAVERSQA
jgi:hypothetical protein